MGLFGKTYYGSSSIVKSDTLRAGYKRSRKELCDKALERIALKESKSRDKDKGSDKSMVKRRKASNSPNNKRKRSGRRSIIPKQKRVPMGFKPLRKLRGKRIGKPRTMFEI